MLDFDPDFKPYEGLPSPKRDRRLLYVIVGGLVVVGVGCFAWAARAHDALPTAAKPNGWSYPFSCCSGYDCREVGDASTPNATIRIFERPEGYVISSTGEVVSYTDQRLKDSPDGVFHWCSVAGANNSRTICLFRPQRGY